MTSENHLQTINYTIGQKVITLFVVVIIIGNYFFVDCNTSPRAS